MKYPLNSKLTLPADISVIKNEAEHEAALAEVEQLMGNVKLHTPEGNRLDLLVTLIEAYEDIHYPMGGGVSGLHHIYQRVAADSLRHRRLARETC